MLMDVNKPSMNTMKKEMADVKTFQMEMIVKKMYLWWKIFYGLESMRHGKRKQQWIEHTAMAIEHNIRVKKKMLREAASDHPTLFSIGVLEGWK